MAACHISIHCSVPMRYILAASIKHFCKLRNFLCRLKSHRLRGQSQLSHPSGCMPMLRLPNRKIKCHTGKPYSSPAVDWAEIKLLRTAFCERTPVCEKSGNSEWHFCKDKEIHRDYRGSELFTLLLQKFGFFFLFFFFCCSTQLSPEVVRSFPLHIQQMFFVQPCILICHARWAVRGLQSFPPSLSLFLSSIPPPLPRFPLSGRPPLPWLCSPN